MVTKFELLEIVFGGILAVGDVIDFVQFEEIAGFLLDDDVEDIDILFVDGENAFVDAFGLAVPDEAVEAVGQC